MAPKWKEHYLSFLDQQPHIRNYGRSATIFPFPDIGHAHAAVQALRAGLTTILQRYPHLAGELSVPYPTNGKLKLRFPGDMDPNEEANRILNESFAVAADAPYPFKRLERTHFDPATLPAEIVCPSLIQSHPGLDDPHGLGPTTLTKGLSIPIMAAQATFVPGGLVLTCWLHHCIADGAGAGRIYEVWSRGVREFSAGSGELVVGRKPSESKRNPRLGLAKLTRQSKTLRIEAVDSGVIERALDSLARASIQSSILPLFTHPTPPRHRCPYTVTSTLLRFPTCAITTLRTHLSTLTRTQISPFIALAALLWYHITRARSVSSSTLAVIVDLRSRLGAPFLDRDYIGNCVMSVRPTCLLPPTTKSPKSELENLAPLAKSIANAVNSYTHERVISRLSALIRSATTPSPIDNGALTFANGPDIYITDVRHLGMDNEWCIPGAATKKPVAMRRVGWKGEGGIVVLPMRKGGDVWEVMVGLEEGEIGRLRGELEGSGWLVGSGERAKL